MSCRNGIQLAECRTGWCSVDGMSCIEMAFSCWMSHRVMFCWRNVMYRDIQLLNVLDALYSMTEHHAGVAFSWRDVVQERYSVYMECHVGVTFRWWNITTFENIMQFSANNLLLPITFSVTASGSFFLSVHDNCDDRDVLFRISWYMSSIFWQIWVNCCWNTEVNAFVLLNLDPFATVFTIDFELIEY